MIDDWLMKGDWWLAWNTKTICILCAAIAIFFMRLSCVLFCLRSRWSIIAASRQCNISLYRSVPPLTSIFNSAVYTCAIYHFPFNNFYVYQVNQTVLKSACIYPVHTGSCRTKFLSRGFGTESYKKKMACLDRHRFDYISTMNLLFNHSTTMLSHRKYECYSHFFFLWPDASIGLLESCPSRMYTCAMYRLCVISLLYSTDAGSSERSYRAIHWTLHWLPASMPRHRVLPERQPAGQCHPPRAVINNAVYAPSDCCGSRTAPRVRSANNLHALALSLRRGWNQGRAGLPQQYKKIKHLDWIYLQGRVLFWIMYNLGQRQKKKKKRHACI